MERSKLLVVVSFSRFFSNVNRFIWQVMTKANGFVRQQYPDFPNKMVNAIAAIGCKCLICYLLDQL